jgi:23S rRNA (adenine2503-C2)-methyltransferase
VTPHLLDLSLDELEAHLAGWGEPRYRAAQIARWTLREGVTSFEAMTNLPAPLRARLAEEFSIAPPTVLATRAADDGSTTKVLLDLGNGEAIESVRMDYDTDPDDDAARTDHARGAAEDPATARGRTTVCVSTQAGCAMGCIFCATGQQGFTRNLTPAEIVAQVLHFSRERRVGNVVFMGMGEPLANYDGMIRAIRWLTDPRGLDMRQRGVTVSTVGLIRPIQRLAGEGLQIGLTISLHAPDDTLRRHLIPTAGGVTIDALLDAGAHYQQTTGRRVTYAYALLEGVNDEPEHARALAARLRGRPVHVNLIPYNPTAGDELRRPGRDRVRAFRAILTEAGVNATVRIERGVEIAAACGQLRTDVARGGAEPISLETIGTR